MQHQTMWCTDFLRWLSSFSLFYTPFPPFFLLAFFFFLPFPFYLLFLSISYLFCSVFLFFSNTKNNNTFLTSDFNTTLTKSFENWPQLTRQHLLSTNPLNYTIWILRQILFWMSFTTQSYFKSTGSYPQVTGFGSGSRDQTMWRTILLIFLILIHHIGMNKAHKLNRFLFLLFYYFNTD